MKVTEMTNEQIAQHINEWRDTGLWKSLPPLTRAVIEESINRLLIDQKTVWDYEVVDKSSLIKHIAKRPELSGLLVIDSIVLRAYVRSMKANTNLPGLRAFPKQTLKA